MSMAFELIQLVEAAGGRFKIDGERLGIVPALAAQPLREELRRNKPGIIAVLQKRPATPPGVVLLEWNLLAPPVQLNRYTTVIDTEVFAKRTLELLRAALRGETWAAGNWSVTELIARLEWVGVYVQLVKSSKWLQ